MAVNDNRRKAYILVVGVFALGFAAGALAMNLYFSPVRGADPGRPGSSRASRKEILDRLTEELGLTPIQAQQIDVVLAETREEYLRLRKETQPQYHQIRGRSRDRIRAMLRPDQLTRFEEMVKRRDEERKKHYERDDR